MTCETKHKDNCAQLQFRGKKETFLPSDKWLATKYILSFNVKYMIILRFGRDEVSRVKVTCVPL